eukprot:8520666-Pyramimonas_sp.AAC.1
MSILARLGICSGESDELPQRKALERTVIACHTFNSQSGLSPMQWSLPEVAAVDSARAARALLLSTRKPAAQQFVGKLCCAQA